MISFARAYLAAFLLTASHSMAFIAGLFFSVGLAEAILRMAA